MANIKESTASREYATVDTDPAAAGYWTNEVDLRTLRSNGAKEVYFTIAETSDALSVDVSVVTVCLQFLFAGRWQDFMPLDGSSLAIGNRLAINDIGAAVRWRAGVKDTGYGSGSVTFGFDW
jgi:hypothetical protein